jgi:hypothetical protein
VSQSRRRRSAARSNQRRGANDRDFWGTAVEEPDEVERIRPAAEPNAMINSLGPAPLPGRETIAEHYFAAIYERAAALAVAIAASSDLLEASEEES